MKPDSKALALTLLALLTPLVHADPISTLTCQTTNGSTFTSPVYSFYLNGGSVGSADLALDLSTFPALLSAVAVKTAYSTCTLSNGATSVRWSGASFIYAEADGTSLAGPALEFYAMAILSYTSSTISGLSTPSHTNGPDTPGK